MGSAGEVSGAAHLPAKSASRTIVASLTGDRAVTALRLEGVLPSILHRQHLLEELLKPFGEITVLSEGPSRALWRSIRDVMPFSAASSGKDRPLWRISTAPTQGPEVAARIAAQTDVSVIYDWAGGLVWALLPQSLEGGGAAIVRAAVAASGGHATLIRAAPAVRAAVPVFEPQDAVTGLIAKRIKQNFDPHGVLNPGRMYAGV
jgi:glycolate oxidase FAD binding subunit